MFEDFIRHVRTDIYHLMCSIIAQYKQQPSYEDEGISIIDRPIPKNETIESLESLGSNLKCIDFWIELSHHNYEVRWKCILKPWKSCSRKYQQ